MTLHCFIYSIVTTVWLGLYITSTSLDRKVFVFRALSVSFSSVSLATVVILVDLVVLSWARINSNSGNSIDKYNYKIVIGIVIVKNVILFLIIVGNIIISAGNWNMWLTVAWTVLFQVFSFIDLFIAWTLFIIMNLRTTSLTKESSSPHVVHVHKKV